LTDAFRNSSRFHGWSVGRYVIMPDHVHFFARPQTDAKTLSDFIRDWKKWTTRELIHFAKASAPVWQPEFFDHLLRSADSYSEKWDYVRHNPVRAGLSSTPEEWSHSGECEVLTF
jgi:REP element-mobilizing transposase RayT